MTYYKVKEKYDGVNVNPLIADSNILIKNELITTAELKRLLARGLSKYKNYANFFDVVEVSKNKTYFFFGARYESGANNI